MMHSNEMAMASSIQELELELELLKRKRLLVQQQHQLNDLPSRNRQYDYTHSQPREKYNQKDARRPKQNINPWESRYDEPNSSDYSGRQFGLKRQSSDNWNQSGPSKRFSVSPRIRNRKPTSDPKPLPSLWSDDIIKPEFRSMSKSAIRAANFRDSTFSPQNHLRKNFKPNKPKTNATNKLGDRPISERKQLISKTSDLTQNVTNNILRADVTPTKQMTGRMELTLGNILKEVKTDHEKDSKYKDLFHAESSLRVIKQAIRERMRTALIDKVVGSVNEIIAHYREMFPKDTDQEMLEIASKTKILNSTDRVLIRLIKKDLPQEYFKVNLTRLLTVKLRDMFSQLEKICQDKSDGVPTQDLITAKLKEIEQCVNTSKKTESVIKNNDIEIVDESKESNSDINKTKSDVADTNVSNIESNVDTKNTPSNIENIDTNGEATETNPADIGKIKTDDLESTDIDETTYKAWKYINDKFFKAEFYETLMMNMLDNKLSSFFKNDKYLDLILASLNVDKMYQKTKTEILRVTKKKIGGAYKVDVSKVPDIDPLSKAQKTFIVKVFGRPRLPEKSKTKEFLEQFNPVHIKKHKNVHYLLFITLNNEEDYNKILAANGSTIGESVLTIVPNDGSRVPLNKKPIITDAANHATKLDSAEGDAKNVDGADDDVIHVDSTEDDAIHVDSTEDNSKNVDSGEDGATKVDSAEKQLNQMDPSGLNKSVELIDEQTDDLLTSIIADEGEKSTDANADEIENAADMGERENANTDDGDDTAGGNEKETNESNVAEDTAEVEDVSEESVETVTQIRSSSRLAATPSSIRTRRSSRMTQNNQ